MTSFNGKNTVIGHNVDGFAMGNLVRLVTEANTGNSSTTVFEGKVNMSGLLLP